jgi:hypothetical protein
MMERQASGAGCDTFVLLLPWKRGFAATSFIQTELVQIFRNVSIESLSWICQKVANCTALTA